MGKTLVIHAGFHKTGTTALQTCFFRNYNELKRVGLLFPKTGMTFIKNSPRPNACSGHDLLLYMSALNSTESKRNLYSEGTSLYPSVLVSSENLLHPFRSPRSFKMDIENLLNFLSDFEKKIMVITVKRPEKMFRSLFSELVTGGNSMYTGTYQDFFDSVWHSTDMYREKVEMARFLGFDVQYIFCAEDTISSFCNFLSRNQLISSEPSLKNVEAIYSSPSLEHEAVVRTINRLKFDKTTLKQIYKKIFDFSPESFQNKGIKFGKTFLKLTFWKSIINCWIVLLMENCPYRSPIFHQI